MICKKVSGPHLPENPQVVYRGISSLRLQIALNIIEPSKKSSFFQNMGGFFPVGNALFVKSTHICVEGLIVLNLVLPMNSSLINPLLHIHPKILCILFVVRTGFSRLAVLSECFRQDYEHIANIKEGFPKHSLSKQYALRHNQNPKGTTFLGIDRFTSH